jgi:hypothetical protein
MFRKWDVVNMVTKLELCKSTGFLGHLSNYKLFKEYPTLWNKVAKQSVVLRLSF